MATVTIRMLASALNLSPGTVSKALKDSYEISAETKLKVMEMAERMDYIPNPYAGGLRKRKSKTIGIVLPAISDSFFSLAIEGIETVAHEKGYHVLICLSHERYPEESAILKDFGSGRVDGVLMSVASETSDSRHIHSLLEKDVPVVLFDRVREDVKTAQVSTDDQEAGYTATKHLIERDCKRILYLSISESLSICKDRMIGYQQALRDHHLPEHPEDIVLCTGNTEQMGDIIKAALSVVRPKGRSGSRSNGGPNSSRHDARPDGIVASVEKLVTPVYLSCKALNLSIPKDIKVVCFSNMAQAPLLSPSLTTITQPAFEIGKRAASLLFEAMAKAGGDMNRAVTVLPSALTVREST